MRHRASALGGLFLTALLAVTPVTPSAAGSVVGHPRCDLDGVIADYTWWDGAEELAVTESPQFEWEGALYEAGTVDCDAVISCMIEWPELAGRAATIVGTPEPDHLVGTAGPDLIVGGLGADRLVGGGGSDVLCGGPGNDVLLGGRGADRLFGRSGDDELVGGGNRDVLNGGAGRDAIFGGRGDDLLMGRQGRDALYGGIGEDDLRGGVARDVCFGGADPDEFSSCGIASEDEITYGSGTVHTFRVQIDRALGESAALTAAQIDHILSDGRSWVGDGTVRWLRVASDERADLTVILAAPATVDAVCAPLRTGGYYSCRNGDRVAINVNRWNGATHWWPASVDVYRAYVVNHEIGHFLGHGHAACPGAGQPARVMQQQTKRLDGCTANGWVFPTGVP